MTMVIKSSDKNAVKYAVRTLKQGGVIIYPTETSYGIGADFTNTKAKRRIYKIKGRMKSKKLSVIFGNIKIIKKYAKIDKHASSLANKFMPGPLTLVVPAKQQKVSSKLPDTIAFRIPSHKFALALAKKFKKPITATSANISDKPPLYKIRDVIRVFGVNVNLIIDAGDLAKRKPSTIYNVTKKKVLRKGPVSEKEILKPTKHNQPNRKSMQ